MLSASVSSSSVLSRSPERRRLMIEALCEIKRHPDDNGLLAGLDDRGNSDEWEDGERERCCRSKTLRGRSKVNTSHRSRYPDRNTLDAWR